MEIRKFIKNDKWFRNSVFIVLGIIFIILLMYLFVSFAFYSKEIIDVPFINGVVGE